MPRLTSPGRPRAVPEGRSYPEFRRAFHNSPCLACGLSKTRTNLVLDRGNAASKLLIVGEAPGAEEDKAGRSFVGRSGKLLDKIFASVGVDTNEDAYITNVVKCRPPANRVPSGEEAAACAPFLDFQVRLLEPEIVVTLGATSFKRLSPDRAFSDSVGRPFETRLGGRPVTCFPLYHPAYLLYDPKRRVEMRAHVRALAAILGSKGLLKGRPISEGGF